MRWLLSMQGATRAGDLEADAAVLAAIQAFYASLAAAGSGISVVQAYMGEPDGVASDLGLPMVPTPEEPAP